MNKATFWKLYSNYEVRSKDIWQYIFSDSHNSENNTSEENRRIIYDAVPGNTIESDKKDEPIVITKSNFPAR